YFAKQTGTALILAGLCIVLVIRWRIGWIYALGAAAMWGATAWILNARSEGWFWNWVVRAHARHAFYARRAFLETPWTLIKAAAGIWAVGVIALVFASVRREWSRERIAWTLAAAAGAGVACIAFGTQWAFTNAYIPGVFFPLVGVAALAGTPSL